MARMRISQGAVPRFVSLKDDFPSMRRSGRRRSRRTTRAVILNTPNNPTGKVFTRKELSFIADLCTDHDAVVITDEIYEHIVYDGHKHISIGSLAGNGGSDPSRSGASPRHTA